MENATSESERTLKTIEDAFQKLSKLLRNNKISLEENEKRLEILWNINTPI